MGANSKSVCVACRHQIPDGASKCSTCGTLQSTWRHLSIGQSTLALIVALVSVIGLAGEHLYSLVSGDYSDIRMAVVESNRFEVTMLASNSGNRAGIIYGGELEVVGNWGNAIIGLDVEGGAIFVEPGKDVLVKFKSSLSESSDSPVPFSVPLEDHLKELQVSIESAVISDCLISIEHILYEHTEHLEPMKEGGAVYDPSAKGAPKKSYLTRTFNCRPYFNPSGKIAS